MVADIDTQEGPVDLSHLHVSAHRIARLPDAERVRFEGKSLGQIATKTGIPKASLHRYLGTAETGA